MPHFDSAQGPTPGALAHSGRETINLGSGQLNAFFPILELPQHGGGTLRLGYVYSGNPWSTKETATTYGQYGGSSYDTQSTYWLEENANLDYVQSHTGPLGGVLRLNLPTLNADFMYMGKYTEGGSVVNYAAVHCMTNWTFSDWSGATHSFNGYRDCDNPFDPFTIPGWLKQTEASDGSGYAVDLTSPNDPQVIGPDGTVFHFPAYTPPPTRQDPHSPNNNNVQLDRYEQIFSRVQDRNNNVISYSPDSRQITDSNGQKISVTFDGTVSWTYIPTPGGTAQQLTASLSTPSVGSNTTLDTNQVPSCQAKNPSTYADSGAQRVGYNGPQIYGPSAPTVPSSSELKINLPDNSFYLLDLDSLGRAVKIRYPSGGYTRYDYQTISSSSSDEGDMVCQRPTTVVVAKHECSDPSANCAQSPQATQDNCAAGFPAGGEATTCYLQGNYGATVISPTQDSIFYQFTEPLNGGTDQTTASIPGWTHPLPPLEATRTVYSAGNSNPIEEITTLFVTPTDCPQTGQYCDAVPAGNKTTLYDASGKVASVAEHDETIQYPNYLLSSTDKDFNSNTIDTVTNTYETGGIYSVTGTAGNLYHILDAIKSSVATENVANLSRTTTNSYDTSGNLMQVAVSGTNFPTATTKVQRNAQGDVTQFSDPMQVAGTHSGATTIGYGSQTLGGGCPTSTGPGQPTSITNALGQTTYASYYPTGQVACVKDANKQITQYGYDPLGRVNLVNSPDGGQLQATYPIATPLVMTTMQTQNTGGGTIKKDTVLDGLGRVAQQVTHVPEGSGKLCTETFYDGLGRIAATNDPRDGCLGSVASGASVQYAYDGLGRKTQQINEDGSNAQWQFNVATVSYTDPRGNVTQRTNDALGRLVKVVEPTANGTPASTATYSYDGFGNLMGVSQTGQGNDMVGSRSFSYDGLSRLITAQNVESGTVCYGTVSSSGSNQPTCQPGYDLNGNVSAKTDARGVVTNYTYDTLNRLVARHSGSPRNGAGYSACYAFDSNGSVTPTNGVGRLAAEWTQSAACAAGSPGIPSSGMLTGKAITAYDAVGRVTSEQTCTLAGCSSPHAQTYAYDLTGSLTSYTDGLNMIGFGLGYDAAGRFQSMTSSLSDAAHPANLLNITQYGPFGWVTGTMGNSLNLQRTYDNRERVSSSTVKAAGVSQ